MKYYRIKELNPAYDHIFGKGKGIETYIRNNWKNYVR